MNSNGSQNYRDGPGPLATYAYDDRGRRSSLTRGNGTVTTYAYDAASRLTQLGQDLAGTASDLVLGFGYNPAGQIVSNTRSNDSYSFTGHANGSVADVVNGLNQVTQTGGTNVVHDARGNITAIGGSAFSYNAANQLYRNDSNLYLFYSDPLGRLSNVIPPDWSSYRINHHAGGRTIAEDAGWGTILRRYVHGPGIDEPLVWYEGSGTIDRRWLHADERGSIVAISDGSGNLVGTVNRYDEYGMPQGGALTGRFGYTGQIWLPELGLYYYKARVYSPTLGRFLQVDPVGYDDQFNLYAYVANDPVNSTDPSGMAICGSCSGYTIQVGSVNFAAMGRRFESNLLAAYGAEQTRGELLNSCRTSRPADICGMVQDMSPRARTTMRAFVNNGPARRAIVTELTEAVRTGNERSIWFNNGLGLLARQGGGYDYAQFYPIPEGGKIFLHFHLRTIAEGYIPGLSPQDMSLGAGNSIMMIVMNREQEKYYWADYRR